MTDYTSFVHYRIGSTTELDSEPGYVPEEFENRVLAHIVMNYTTNAACPLYLSIHGPMGNGKTFQTLRTCSKYGIVIYYISAAELSGSFESDSISNLQKNLEDAEKRFKRDMEYSVFIIDDFHLSVASTEPSVGHTVNSQLLTGRLMNIADSANQGKKQRIPFILLGNDFTNLYAPLTRDGRMDFYEWNPTVEQKAKIFSECMESISTDDSFRNACRELVRKYPEMPISFFTQVRHDLEMKRLLGYIEQEANQYVGIQNLISGYRSYNRPNYSIDTMLQQIQDLAKHRYESRQGIEIVHESRGDLHG